MSLKNNLFCFLILCSCIFCICASSDPLDAGKNASLHNNLGVQYMKENNYIGAIKEFEIAIGLNPNKQVSATYYYNLGTLFFKTKNYEGAKSCFETSISINPLYFRYYIDVVKTYKELHILDTELQKHLKEKNNPLSALYIGLIYIEQGKKQAGIITLDNFCEKEPYLLVTAGVRNYLSQLSKEK